jgi:serine/threonine protein kinase
VRDALAPLYEVERELGQGGMATVYLAIERKHDRRVAVKVLRPEIAAILGPDRFLREIHIAARLSHPHIVPLLASGQAGSILYYVMPFIEGESLRARLDRERQLPIDTTLRITRQIAAALSRYAGVSPPVAAGGVSAPDPHCWRGIPDATESRHRNCRPRPAPAALSVSSGTNSSTCAY